MNTKKELIAKTTYDLLFKERIKTLKVTDITKACGIKRQTFYYYFEDIPDLLGWMLEQGQKTFFKDFAITDDDERNIKNFLLMTSKVMPNLKQSLTTNYGEKIKELLKKNAEEIFVKIASKKGLYEDKSLSEVKIILRYHIGAIMTYLADWSDEDDENIDKISHIFYLLLTQGIDPRRSDR